MLASKSRYSRLPGAGGKGTVQVTAAAIVHASVLGSDEQLSTTLEEALRCPDQQPRDDERITGRSAWYRCSTPMRTRNRRGWPRPSCPAPPLAEAVEECGPLPHGPVRFLGARLAEAPGAVHRAGLVHRDVKPGNVLLALDGPRVIDFGIARAPEDTALVPSGMVGSAKPTTGASPRGCTARPPAPDTTWTRSISSRRPGGAFAVWASTGR